MLGKRWPSTRLTLAWPIRFVSALGGWRTVRAKKGPRKGRVPGGQRTL